MLPQYYRFILVNNSGQTVTHNNNGRLVLRMTAWHLDSSDGKIVYTPLSDDDFGFIAGDSMVDGAEEKTSEINNTANLYLGLQVQIEVKHDEGTLADGTFDLYLDGGDGTADLASDKSGYASAEANKLQFVGLLTWESNGLDDEIMLSPVFNI